MSEYSSIIENKTTSRDLWISQSTITWIYIQNLSDDHSHYRPLMEDSTSLTLLTLIHLFDEHLLDSRCSPNSNQ